MVDIDQSGSDTTIFISVEDIATSLSAGEIVVSITDGSLLPR